MSKPNEISTDDSFHPDRADAVGNDTDGVEVGRATWDAREPAQPSNGTPGATLAQADAVGGDHTRVTPARTGHAGAEPEATDDGLAWAAPAANDADYYGIGSDMIERAGLAGAVSDAARARVDALVRRLLVEHGHDVMAAEPSARSRHRGGGVIADSLFGPEPGLRSGWETRNLLAADPKDEALATPAATTTPKVAPPPRAPPREASSEAALDETKPDKGSTSDVRGDSDGKGEVKTTDDLDQTTDYTDPAVSDAPRPEPRDAAGGRARRGGDMVPPVGEANTGGICKVGIFCCEPTDPLAPSWADYRGERFHIGYTRDDIEHFISVLEIATCGLKRGDSDFVIHVLNCFISGFRDDIATRTVQEA